MPQINLLKQTGQSYDFSQTIAKIVVKILVAGLAVLIIYYGWLFFASSNVDKAMVRTNAQMVNDKQAALKLPDREELLTRQLQLKSLQGLIASHVYWSQLFAPLADATLKNATYANLKFVSGQDLDLTVTVPTLTDLDKFTQVFDIPKFYGNFSNIRIGSYTKVQGKTSNAIKFDLRMKFNPGLIQYQSKNNGS